MTEDEEAQLRATIRAAKTLADRTDVPEEHRRAVLRELGRVARKAASEGRSAIKSAAYRARRALKGK